MSAPLVSIVTPAYNVEKYIGAAITSVIEQTYENWELIIIDDYSEDDTFNIASSYARKDERIKVLRMWENSGAAIARNFGIATAAGSYIAFLDSDDLWLPEKLEIQVRQMITSDALFSFTGYKVISEDGEFIKNINVPAKIDYRKLLQGCDIGCLTVIYNAERLGKMFFPDSRTNTGLVTKEDYMLWLRISKMIKSHQILSVNTPLAMYRKRYNSVSSNKIKAAGFQWFVYRKVEHLNVANSVVNFLSYSVKGIIKHYIV